MNMDFSEFSLKYWQKPDTKILLANYIRQKELGIIPDPVAVSFENHLSCCNSVEPFAFELLAGNSGSGSTFDLERNHFCSPISPQIASEQIIIRVVPLDAILSRVEIDMNGGEQTLIEQLEIYRDINKNELTRVTAEKNLRTAFGQSDFSNFEFEWPEILEPFCTFALEAKLKRENGAGITETKSKQPRFISYLTDHDGGENATLTELKDGLTTSRGVKIADFVRDIFGLDHLAETYKKIPNVLGFVAYQASELDKYQCTRPTVFDDTSALRFRGSNSADTPNALQWGRTANLSKLYENQEKGKNESIIGCPEAVINNPRLLGERRVLVGYLGPLEVPHHDTNDLDASTKPEKYARMQELHEAFLQKCLSGMSSGDVYAAIFEGS